MIETETGKSSDEEIEDEMQGIDIPGSWQDFGGDSESKDEEYDLEDWDCTTNRISRRFQKLIDCLRTGKPLPSFCN